MSGEVTPSVRHGADAAPAQWLGRASEPHAYQVIRKLGAGGMGEVVLATRTAEEGLARQVAIKLLQEDFAKVRELRELFATEARLASRLLHPNIVAVHDYACDEGARPFLVMEYVCGVDLSVALGHPRPLPVAVATFIAAEILRGLAYAHALPGDAEMRGVVHRDLSPQNVLLSWEGAVKVADFGIAKALVGSSVSGAVVGKPAYMSPEQVRRDRLDGRSDLYSAGVVLWEMLTGRRLFGRGRVKEIFAKIALGEVPAPSSLRAEVPEALDRVTSRLLAVDLAERYPRAEEALAELVACPCMPIDGAGELVSALAERFHRPPRGGEGISMRTDEPKAEGDSDPTPTIRTETDETRAYPWARQWAPVLARDGGRGAAPLSPGAVVEDADGARGEGSRHRPAVGAESTRGKRRALGAISAVGAISAMVALAVLLALLASGGARTRRSSASPSPAPGAVAPGSPLAERPRPAMRPAERTAPPTRDLAPRAGRPILSPAAPGRSEGRPAARRGLAAPLAPPAPPAPSSGIVDLHFDERAP